ncbi:hypothetical protein QR680_009776 [Steinernema hermaphroditum]|uniref:Uncharacterized protein n=1 Tax=Steinernema hermaphroditum TaxID=289476 RepID=A0AA39M9I3_9BILA|nr:hypothetical protein QR680_009776 [Steinernema hermaphroditum]
MSPLGALLGYLLTAAVCLLNLRFLVAIFKNFSFRHVPLMSVLVVSNAAATVSIVASTLLWILQILGLLNGLSVTSRLLVWGTLPYFLFVSAYNASATALLVARIVHLVRARRPPKALILALLHGIGACSVAFAVCYGLAFSVFCPGCIQTAIPQDCFVNQCILSSVFFYQLVYTVSRAIASVADFFFSLVFLFVLRRSVEKISRKSKTTKTLNKANQFLKCIALLHSSVLIFTFVVEVAASTSKSDSFYFLVIFVNKVIRSIDLLAGSILFYWFNVRVSKLSVSCGTNS